MRVLVILLDAEVGETLKIEAQSHGDDGRFQGGPEFILKGDNPIFEGQFADNEQLVVTYGK